MFSNNCKWLIFISFCILFSTYSIHHNNIVLADEALLEEKEVIWKPCDHELKTTSVAKDIKVFVPQCPPINGTETRCPMIKGYNATLRIQFRPIQAVPSIERVMVARVPISDKYVEMPYGPSISPCENSATIADDGSGCVEDGVEADKLYTYTSLFKVLKSFPTVQNITTRVIIRQKYDDHKKIRLYRKHPGPVLVCAMIPNIEVAEETVQS